MSSKFTLMEKCTVDINAAVKKGPFEWWRHSIGHGAVNSTPLPDRVVDGVKKLGARTIRIFLQEYFRIYPGHGVFDWNRLDPYMDSLEKTGADVIATINIKPKVLFPAVDHSIWRPENVEEWQEVIYQLVKRYSADRRIVTHWEHANEPDIGEIGGCPFLIPTAEENYEFYKILIKPILEAFPEAKVGGPALAGYSNPIMKGFIELCHSNNTPLDFVSWHSYCDDPSFFVKQIEEVGKLLEIYSEKRPEMFLNELNKGFDFLNKDNPDYFLISTEEMAFLPERAAFTAFAVLRMMETGVGLTNYFLLWDCCMHPEEFKSFYSEKSIREVMYKHWNESPHRFGLFSEGGSVRPQYFVYKMLGSMDGEKLETCSSGSGIAAQAVNGSGRISLLASNYRIGEAVDTVITARFSNLEPGVKRLVIYRIDENRCWDPEKLELLPVDRRKVDVLEEFEYQCYCPANSVVMLTLETI